MNEGKRSFGLLNLSGGEKKKKHQMNFGWCAMDFIAVGFVIAIGLILVFHGLMSPKPPA
jgi:hypothetical protein